MAMARMKPKKITMAKITTKTKTVRTTKIMKMIMKIVDAGIKGVIGRIGATGMIVMREDESAENERD